MKVAVIGGGILGLSAAYRLQKEGHEVLILEKADVLGGALRSYSIDGYDIEQFYHHFFTIDKDFVAFLNELGLSEKVMFGHAVNGFCQSGRLYPLFRPTDMLSFKPLSFRAKIGVGKFVLATKLIKDVKSLDTISAEEWLLKIAGKEAYEQFFRYLLKSKFASDYQRVSAAWFIERISLRSDADSKGERLGYLRGGFQQMIGILEREILKKGGEIVLSAQVEGIEVKEGRAVSVRHNGKTHPCDAIISSIPPFILTKLVSFPKEYETRLNALEYQPAVCVLIGLRKELSGKFYWTNVLEEGNSFGAFIEHTSLIPKEDYKGTTLVYLASYVDLGSELMRMDGKKVFEKYFNDLKRMFPHLTDEDVLWFRVGRDANSGLIYKKGILDLLPSIETPIKNIFIGGMFNSYPDRSISKSVEIGSDIADRIDRGEV